MLRIISLFLLLIISQVTIAETIPATSDPKGSASFSFGSSGLIYKSAAEACTALASTLTANNAYYTYVYTFQGVGGLIYETATTVKYYCTISRITESSTAANKAYVLFSNNSSYAVSGAYSSSYSCSSGYFVSDSAGNADSSGHYCTKNSCQDLYQTTSMIDIPPRQTVTNACFNGCSATSMLGTWVCDSDTACSVRVQFDGNSCSGGVDYAANASSSDSGSDSDSPPCSGGSTTGTVNGETVTTCADDGTDSPPITDTSSSSTPTTSTSGAGSTVGSPDNTSGSTSSTVGGGTDGLGGDGYGEGGSAGSSGGTSGTDSGGTSGTDSGGTSGSDSGSTSGSDSGSTSGTDSGGTSGSSGGTDSGGTSGSGGGTDSGGTSGSGGGTDSGTATSGAGGTDPDAPDTEEEEESGDGGGLFSEPAEGKDYFSDLFGTADLQDLADKKTAIENSISTKKTEIKGLFQFNGISMSGSLSENTQEVKGASIDLSGKSTFDRFSYIAAILYFTAIIIAIWIVLGDKK